jgi:hypothetical protein
MLQMAQGGKEGQPLATVRVGEGFLPVEARHSPTTSLVRPSLPATMGWAALVEAAVGERLDWY